MITGILGGLTVLIIIPFALKASSLTPNALDYLKFMLLINTYYITGTSVLQLQMGEEYYQKQGQSGIITENSEVMGEFLKERK